MPHQTTQGEKLRWLLKHRDLWDYLYLEDPLVMREIAQRMQEEGLFSKKSRSLNLSKKLWQLIEIARKYAK